MRALFVLVLGFFLLFPLQKAKAEESTSTATVPRPESPLGVAVDAQFAQFQVPNYQWAPGFTDVPRYGSGARFALEWIPFGDAVLGKLGLGAAAGGGVIGRVNLPNGVSRAELLPIDVYAKYHLDVFHNQAIVPFVRVGVNRTYFTQFVSGVRGETRSYEGFEYGLGVSFNLGVIDPLSARDLDIGIGINRTYLTFEYINSRFLNTFTASAPNLTRDEYRLGVRFEM